MLLLLYKSTCMVEIARLTLISKLARKHLAILASSAPSEVERGYFLEPSLFNSPHAATGGMLPHAYNAEAQRMGAELLI